MLAPSMASHSFLTTWCVAAPIEPVWDLLSKPETYPEWWKGVREARVLEPGEDGTGVGTLYRQQWRSKLPWNLEFDMRSTRVEKPYLLEARASGELVGVGLWRLFESPVGTVALYNWDVSTRAKMNRVAVLARPVFGWNHDYIMRCGAEGLADKLGVALLTHN